MSTDNAADLLVATLAAAGVERVYGIVGDSLNGFTEALRKHGGIEWIHVRNEEVAAFAAGAEAHLTGSLAVCAGSSGPGNLHLINGLFDCHRSRVPVLAIAAQIPSAEIGRGYFQETHPQNLFQECSHYCELVSSTAQLPGVFETAIRTAVVERGVSVVVLPGDVALTALSEPIHVSASLVPATPTVRPAASDVDALVALLGSGGRVTLLCGSGCAGAREQVLALAERLKAPIVHALGGKEHIEHDNPYDVGMTGLLGFASGYRAMLACDTLVMLGTDFPYRQFFPTGARVVQVDIRGGNLGRRCRLDLGVVGDVAATIDEVLPRLAPEPDSTHLDESVAHYRKTRSGLDALAESRPGHGPLHPQLVAKTLDALMTDDAVITYDVGTPTIWTARYISTNGRRRLIGSLNHGSMANAMAQAIGAQASYPGRQVVSFSGDGGFTMLMGDLLTLVQQQLPVKVVVLNNGALGFVELEMKEAGLLGHGVALTNPDFAALASSVGLLARRVEEPGELEAAMREVLDHDGPALLDVVCPRQELPLPPHIDVKEAAGFSVWMAKAVLDGRGGEIVDLARTNLKTLTEAPALFLG